jgi:glycosyltransferase involved in cell wall biosynthesis
MRRRVLIVASTLHLAGAERIMVCLARALDRRSFDVSVCYLKEYGEAGDEMARAGVEVLALPGRVYGRREHLTSLKLRRLARERRVDLLHTHDLHGFIDASVCRWLMPGIKHVHTFHFGNYPQRNPRYRLVEKLLWRSPDRLVAVGDVQKQTICAAYGIPPERIATLWNGADAPVPNIAPEILAATEGCRELVIMSVSTLIPQKGLSHLLDAAHVLKNKGLRFRLLLVGGGELKNALAQQCRRLGLEDCVRLVGWVGDASNRALPACDIFVQSSLWEAMSVVVLEAMAGGKPMVVTSVGENAKVVQDGISGLVVPPADAAALAAALQRLLVDQPLRARLATAARARHAEHFTVESMVRRYEALYAGVLGADR